jgi:hypothetical protein
LLLPIRFMVNNVKRVQRKALQAIPIRLKHFNGD